MAIEVIGSIILILIGAVGVHKSNGETSRWKKAAAVMAVMAGSTALWTLAAREMPAVKDVQIELVGETDDGALLHFSATATRRCQIEGVEATLSSPGGPKYKIPTQIIAMKKDGVQEEGFLLLQNAANYSGDYANFTFKHFCPFGFESSTETDPIKLPNVE